MAKPDSEPSLQRFENTPRTTLSRQEYKQFQYEYQLRVFELIERFYHQIRYGCTAKTCHTKTCRTYRENRTRIEKKPPYRKPTPTSARAHAAYLAALDDSSQHLCPNIPAPNSSPFDIAFPTSKELYIQALSQEMDIPSDPNSKEHRAEWYAKTEMERWMVIQSMSDTPVNLTLPKPYSLENKIDTKSFTQKLFNSSQWRLGLLHYGNSSLYPRKVYQAEFYDSNASQKIVAQEPGTTRKIEMSSEVREYLLDLTQTRNQIYQAHSILLQPGVDGEPWARPALTQKLISPTQIIDLHSVLTNPETLSILALAPAPLLNILFPISYPHRSECFAALGSLNLKELGYYYPEFEYLDFLAQRISIYHLQWLVPSVKTTYFNPNSKHNISSWAAINIIAIAITALVASVTNGEYYFKEVDLWDYFERHRQKGRTMCRMLDIHLHTGLMLGKSILAGWTCAYEDPAAQYLMKLVLRSFASRSYASSPLPFNRSDYTMGMAETDSEIHEDHSDFKNRLEMFFIAGETDTAGLTERLLPALIEWIRTIFLREWNGEARFRWDSDLGAATEFLSWFYKNRTKFKIQPRRFVIDVLTGHMDFVEACRDWLTFKTTPSVGHLFSLPWIMTADTKFTMFRSINLVQMASAYKYSVTTNKMVKSMKQYTKFSMRGLFDLRLSESLEQFLNIEIRRDNILKDSFDQLWQRQKRELFKPLRVRMGMNEGEQGVDMGGVQQEFFRLAIADALDSKYGLFTVDEKTRMTWFRCMSPAPLHQFTLLGLLFGLALYNGITLTVTFPLAFYRKLLGLGNTNLEHIRDGWPELCKGMDDLLAWSGNVENDICREYAFAFENVGLVQQVDMQKYPKVVSWPPQDDTPNDESTAKSSSPEESADGMPAAVGNLTEEELEMVTNDNRIQYVNDYVYWLTDKSIAAQFEAFRTGMGLVVHKKALALLEPEDLQTLVEGHYTIDIAGLRRITLYEDDLKENDDMIKQFWEIVQDMTEAQHKKLLEFVTASPRVPARGMDDMVFNIQQNGSDDQRLPTSMTCFSRLLLPKYSSKAIMAEKLHLAIENSTGFGSS